MNKKLLTGLFVVALIAIDINYSLAHAEVVPETQETDSGRYADLGYEGWNMSEGLDQEPLPVWVLIAESTINYGEK